MNTDELIIYTDGACSGNPGSGGWAAVIIMPENRLIELGGGEKNTTNNRMEMTAAIKALQKACSFYSGSLPKIRFYTDSSLLLNGITKWIWGWLKKGWVSSTGADVANRDLWEQLWAEVSPLRSRIEWIHVKGHAGHDINERCDTIAVSYSKNKPVRLYDGPAIGCGYSLLPPDADNADKGLPLQSDKSVPKQKKEEDKFYISMVNGKYMEHKTWAECEKQVKGKKGAQFKKVYSAEEAAEYKDKWLRQSD